MYTKLALPIAIMTALTACGGNGGNDNPAADGIQPPPNQSPQRPQTPDDQAGQNSGGNNAQTPGGNQNPGGNGNQTPGGNGNQTPGGNGNQNPGGGNGNGKPPQIPPSPPPHEPKALTYTVSAVEGGSYTNTISVEGKSEAEINEVKAKVRNTFYFKKGNDIVEMPLLSEDKKESPDSVTEMYHEDTRNFVPRAYKAFHVSGSSYKNVRFGYVAPKTGSYRYQDFLFHQGDITTNMPNEGQATYRGSAVHVLAQTQGSGNYPGTLEAKADFGTKKLDIAVTAAPQKRDTIFAGLNIKGVDIKGSQFVGNQLDAEKRRVASRNSQELVTQPTKVNVEGAFYGDQAAEMAGTYSTSDAKGVFGGHKQP